MNIALAQIDMRLGDIEGICARVESQAVLAKQQGADLLCVPAPLLGGIMPGGLIDATNYEHELVCSLERLATRLEDLGVVALVPAMVSYGGAPLFEVFVLDRGHAVPARTMLAYRREQNSDDLWAPPVFDVAGTRIAVTFDARRDLELLPRGCDIVVYFQANAFDVHDESSSAVASVADGHFRRKVADAGVWLGCMAPVGAFDEAVYTGGSFVMDEAGRVVAAAPCFEEALLVQEVRRGMQLPCIETHELPQYRREEWLWEALVLAVRDTVAARGCHRAALVLAGDLPSSLAAALCVDALGPRNVVGLLVERSEVFTPAQEAEERERVEQVRALATNLHIRLVEHEAPDTTALADRTLTRREEPLLREQAEGILLEDLARQEHALPVSSITKTDAAISAPALASVYRGVMAPFGDVYLSNLEFLARVRNRSGAAVPPRLVTLNAVEHALSEAFARAMRGGWDETEWADHIARVLTPLEPSQVDGILEAHVDRNLPFEDLPLVETDREAVSLLLVLVRQGEYARRMLPMAPIVSGRSFSERLWPSSLAWSDLGRHGEEPRGVDALAREELDRISKKGDEYGERVRGEVMGLIGDMLGITPEQLEHLQSEEGQRKIRENLQRFEGQVQEAINRMIEHAGQEGPSDGRPSAAGGFEMPHPDRNFPFFSQN